MKMKNILIGLGLLLAFVGIGCGNKEEINTSKYDIYYLDRNENRINAISYETDTPREDKQTLAIELLGQLATQTEKIECKPVINGFSVKDCILHESQINLNFSSEYEMLEPAKEVLIRAAIVKTLTQMDGIELITIQVEGRNLLDAVGGILFQHAAGLLMLVGIVDIFRSIVILNDLILHNTHTGLRHRKAGKGDAGLVGGSGSSKEYPVYLLL